MNPQQLEWVIEGARVPVVRPEHVVWHGDPFYGGAYSAFNDVAKTLFLRHDIDPYGARHELGHVFDYHVLRDEHRVLLLKWWRIPGRFWWWNGDHDPMKRGPEAGCEIFANVYARACVGRSSHRFRKLIRIAYKEAQNGNH